MLKWFFLGLSLAGLATSQCSEGCIVCNISKNKCTLCDSALGYVTQNGRCIFNKLPGCQVQGTRGNCLSCQTGFALTPQKSCIPLRRGGDVANCVTYDYLKRCIECSTGFFVKKNVCVAVAAQIQNCSTYASDGVTCLYCQPGYTQNSDFTQCVQAQSSNCLSYTNVDCILCSSGYIRNTNAVLYDFVKPNSPLQTLIADRFSNIFSTGRNRKGFQICQALSVPNCKEFSTFNSCRVCLSGYYLSDSLKCVLNPLPIIPSCIRYSSPNNCIQCDNGYYIQSSTVCALPSIPIQNCDTYNSTSSVVSCTKCIQNYYLSEPNICTLRTSLSTIPNCIKISDTSETCQVCATGLIPTSDFGACLNPVVNCKSYQTSTSSTTTLSCNQCNDQYYLDPSTGICLKGTKDYCLQYATNANSCIKCFNKFYSLNGSCKAHDELYLCDVYDVFLKNNCSTCKSSAFLFSRQDSCMPVNPIDKCLIYATTTTCSVCEDSYVLNIAGTCDLIPLSLFCLQMSPSNLCIKCHANYVLDNGVCNNFNDELLFFCGSHNLNGLTSSASLTCNYCKNNSIPMNYKNLYSCVSQSILPNNVASIQNCLQFDANSGVCRRCSNGFVLLDGICVTSCSSSLNKQTLYLQLLTAYDTNGDGINDSYSVQSTNECSTTIVNCDIAAPDLSQTNPAIINYACIKCSNGALQKIDFSKRTSTAKFLPNMLNRKSTPVSFQPSFDCIIPNASTIIPSVKPLINNGLDRCENYQQISGWFGCVKCQHGFNGVVIDNILGCLNYDKNNLCIKCQQGFWLVSNLQCAYVSAVPNCEVYFPWGANACQKCRDHFYLSGSTTSTDDQGNLVNISTVCTLRTSFTFNCLTYSLISEDCSQCLPLNYIDSNKQCQPQPPFCKTLSVLFACTVCQDGYYLNNGVCYKGEITNCQIYSDVANAIGPNTCSSCFNGFYLINNSCLAHNPMNNCVTSHPSTKNNCQTCAVNAFRFTITSTCQPYIPITNCLQYDSVYTCSACATTFYLANKNTRCLPIPVLTGCLIMSGVDNCTKCATGYFLISSGVGNNMKCVSSYSDVLLNCDTTVGLANDGLATAQQCAYCKIDPANPYESKDLFTSFRCIENDVIQKQTTLIPNCLKYVNTAGTYTCVTCSSPFVLDSAFENCITDTACFTSGNVVYLSQYASATITTANDAVTKTANSICAAPPADAAPFTFTNCYLAPSLSQSSANVPIDYYCAKCAPTFVAVIETTLFKFVNQKNIGEKPTPYTTYPAVNCVSPAAPSVTSGISNTQNVVTNCEYYLSPGANQIQCFKCKWGYRGVVVANYITSCDFFSDCNTSIYNEGITTKTTERGAGAFIMQSMYTCHSCNSATAKPVVFADLTNTYTKINALLAFYEVLSSPPVYALAAGAGPLVSNAGYDQACIESATLNTSLATGKLNVVNCALYALNLNDLPNPICVACASGFVPTRDAVIAMKVTACATGTNLVASVPKVFNGGVCSAGFVYSYSFSTGVNMQACIAHSDKYCYAANSPNAKCDICLRNAVFNPTTLLCEITVVPYCTSVGTAATPLKSIQGVGFYLADFINGCNACLGSRTPILASTIYGSNNADGKFNVCVLKDPPTPATPTVLDNCQVSRFNLISGRYQCTQCVATWFSSQDGECASIPANPNCSLVSMKAGTFCLNCINNTISKSGVCVAKSILNCSQYMDSSNASYIRCKVCNDNFYEKYDANLQVSTCVDATPLLNYNCASYNTDINTNVVTCVRCNTNFFLLTSSIGPLCYPMVPDIQECATFDQNAILTGELKCTSCIASSLKVPVTIPGRSACITYVGDPKCINWRFDLINTNVPTDYNFVCVQCTNDYYFNTVTNSCVLRTNKFGALCKTLVFNNDQCNECISNYYINSAKTVCVPTPGVQSSPSAFFGYLTSCYLMDSCLPDMIDGIPVGISSLLSCHKCADLARIPFLVVKGGYPFTDILGLQSYNLNSASSNVGFDIGSYGESTVCLPPVATTFGISSNLFAFPDNCAVGVLNANSVPDASHGKTLASVDMTKIAVFCGSCMPGYKATYSTTVGPNNLVVPVPKMIGKCDSISNCESSIWNNYCTQCLSGFSFGYSPLTGVQYDTCVSNNNNKDCHSFDPVALNCIYCVKGTFLNKDGYCERVRQPRCLEGAFLQQTVFALNDLSTGLTINSEGIGCTACEPGYLPLYRPTDFYICTESSYQAKGLATATTKYIFNCKNIFVDSNGVLKCALCKSGFVPISGNGSCLDASSLPYCQIATNLSTCKVCLPGNVLVNRICVPQSLPFCVLYGNNDQSVEQICIGCAEGYYLEANVCKLGNVPNCLVYETQTRCNKCHLNFQLVIRDNGANYCYPIDPQLKCATYDSTQFQKAILKCVQCSSNLLIVSTDPTSFNPNFCLRYSQIRNCVQYDLRKTIASIADSTFGCILCLRNFYLSNAACVPRQYIDQTCLIYNTSLDSCSVCVDGMYLAKDGTCALYPTGVPACITYASPTKCIACDVQFYLSNNLCLAVPTANLLDNCLNYETQTACSVCKPGYIVQGSTCAKTVATNCLTFTNPTACESCPPFFILKSDGTNLNCVQPNIDNCVQYELKEPIRCLVCKTLFYANNGICSPVTTTISRCLVYDTATTCSNCDPNTALAANKTYCDTSANTFSYIDPYCVNSIVVAQPICSLCKMGNYLANGSCTACSQMSTGCLTCDPANPSVCLVCYTNFYMNSSGNCVPYNPQSPAFAKTITN